MFEEFPHLHLHTTHSHLDAYGTPQQFVERAAELGMTAFALTEHGNINSWAQAQKYGRKHGIRPIFGIEAYVVHDLTERSREYHHVTLLAKDQAGIRSLFNLVSKSWTDGFYYKPRMQWGDILANADGLIAFSGCWSGYLASRVRVNALKLPARHLLPSNTWGAECADWIRLMKARFGPRMFMEIMPINSPLQAAIVRHEVDFARKFGIPLVATNDVHYICGEHQDIQDDLVAIRSGDYKHDPNRDKYAVTDLYLKRTCEMYDGLLALGLSSADAEEAIGNAFQLAKDIKAEVPMAEAVNYRPAWMSKGDEFDVPKYFRQVLAMMWGQRKDRIPVDARSIERVKYELEICERKGYLSYLLIIWDLIYACKHRPMAEGGPIFVGPARGSSSGSLLCYILAITEIDPFYDGLIFERFVDINRTDPPDIDIDFPDGDRDWVKEYLRRRWGTECVGTLISHAAYKGRNAIDDISRIYRIPPWAADKLKDAIIERSSGDARASMTIEDTIAQFPAVREVVDKFPDLRKTVRLEGQIRHQATHAAGVIVSTEGPLTDYFAFNRDGCFGLDKKDAEALGHLKVDILGLNTLTVLHRAAVYAGIDPNTIPEWYYRLPMDDPKVIEAFTRADCECIFQFEGKAQMAVTRQAKPTTYNMIRDLTGMSRPGPLHSGGTGRYIQRAHGEPYVIEPPHIEPIVAETCGVILYQEQVMKICRDMGNMDWPTIVDLRRTISKSVGVEHFNKFRDKFMHGAVAENKIPEDIAASIWDQMCTFGSWAFNLSHAAAYTRISVWSMYMKVHHPLAFYAAMAAECNVEDRKSRAVRMFQRRGGKVLPFDVNACGSKFKPDNGALRPGLADLNGVGEKAAMEIEKAAPFTSYQDFLDRVPLRLVNKKVRKVLQAVGAFRAFSGEAAYLKDYAECETDAFIKGFPSKRALGAELCYWVHPIDFESLRLKHRALPLEDIENDEAGGSTRHARGVARIRHINQRSYDELGSEARGRELLARGEEIRFINIFVEDDTDHLIITVPRKLYRKYEELVLLKMKAGSVIYFDGPVYPKMRRVFISNIAHLGDDTTNLRAKADGFKNRRVDKSAGREEKK